MREKLVGAEGMSWTQKAMGIGKLRDIWRSEQTDLSVEGFQQGESGWQLRARVCTAGGRSRTCFSFRSRWTFITAVTLHLCDYLIPAHVSHWPVSSGEHRHGCLSPLTAIPPALAESLAYRCSVHIWEMNMWMNDECTVLSGERHI